MKRLVYLVFIAISLWELWYAFLRDPYRFWTEKEGTERWKFQGHTAIEWKEFLKKGGDNE